MRRRRKSSQEPARSPHRSSADVGGGVEQGVPGAGNAELGEEAPLSFLLDRSNDGLLMLDEAGFPTYTNRRFCEMLGSTRDEVLGSPLRDHISTEGRALFERLLAQPPGDEGEAHEITLIASDGSEVFAIISLQTLPFSRDGSPGKIAVVTDISGQKEVMEHLREEEARLRSIFLVAPVGIGVVSPERKMIQVNDRICEMLGYSREELLGESARMVYATEEEYEYVGQEKYRQIDERGTGAVETRWRRKDGEIIDILLSSTPIDPSDRSLGVTFTALDITERKRAEDTLASSERFYKSLIRNSGDVISILNPDLSFRWGSVSAARITGYTREEIYGMAFIDFIHPDDVGDLMEAASFVLHNPHVPFEIVVRFRHRDGEYHYHEVVGINLLDDPAVKGIVVNSRDITDRRQAEEELSHSTSELQSIFKVLPDLYFRFSTDGTFMDWKTGRESDLYVSPDDFLGKKAKDVLPPPVGEQIEDAIAEVNRTGEMVSIEYSLPMSGGEQIYEARLLPLWEGQLMAVIRNITERKQAEKQLMATTERLRALSARINRAREEERTNIAREVHDELGQLLTALRMDVFWLDKRLPVGEDQARGKLEEMIELIDVSISTVRRISRELRPGVLDELGLAEALRWQLQSFHYRTGMECSFTSSEEDLVVDQARSTALFRIFQEALTNITRHARATEVRVALKCEPDRLLLEIADNGVGMLGEKVNQMESLGILGMKERANIFGGEVNVSGEKGKGTTVKVSIPLA